MVTFCVSLWLEEATPENLKNCSECGKIGIINRLFAEKDKHYKKLPLNSL